VDERTQTNWNGIVGKLELRATAPVWIKDAQVYPDAANKKALVRVTTGNITDGDASGKITLGCKSFNLDQPASFKTKTVAVKVPAGGNEIEITYEPGEDVPLWDEFQPALLRLELKSETQADDRRFADQHSVNFGMRDFKKNRNLLKINGKTIFLRGRLDCANYPLTGYAPMDKAGWRRIF